MAGYLGHKPKISNYTVDEFTTSSAQASSGNFTLAQTVADLKTLEVSVGGIDQPQSAYTVTGTTLAFGASIVAQNDIVIARHAGESISYPSLEASAVTTAKINADAVDGTKIADNAIDSEHYTDASIDLAHMSVNSIDSDQYVDGSIDNAHLADDAVGVAELSATGTASSSTFLRGDNAWAAAGGGKIVQIVNSQTGALATGTTAIPFDDTIPQNTEGDQYLSLAITPTNTNNILEVDWHMNGSYANATAVVISALFQDSTANALASAFQVSAFANSPASHSGLYRMTAGTTSSTTFKIRAGGNSGSVTWTFNGQSGGRINGGVLTSSITITEIEV